MSLPHILLGMLREPSTGYDLGKEFADGAAHFWFAETSQIYPTLKRMEEQGWLACSEEPSERGPPRKVYRTTDAGREELREWLRAGPQIGRERLSFIAQTFFMGELGDLRESRALVRQLRAHWEAELGYMELAERMHLDRQGTWDEADIDHFHHYAALRLGLHMIRSKLAWCDEIDAVIERRREEL